MDLDELKLTAKDYLRNFYYLEEEDDSCFLFRLIDDVEKELINPYVLAYMYRVMTSDNSPIYLIQYTDEETVTSSTKYPYYINKIFFSEMDADLFAKDVDTTKTPLSHSFKNYNIVHI